MYGSPPRLTFLSILLPTRFSCGRVFCGGMFLKQGDLGAPAAATMVLTSLASLPVITAAELRVLASFLPTHPRLVCSIISPAEKTTMQQQQEQQQLSLSPSRSPGLPVGAAPPQAKKTVMVEPTVASGEGVAREGVAASTPWRTACARAALMGVTWSYDMMCYLWSLVFRDDSSAFLVYDRSVHDGCLYDGIALHMSVRVVRVCLERRAGASFMCWCVSRICFSPIHLYICPYIQWGSV